MLTDLKIRNLGVIADAEIEFSSGLTVITGETGAGKTMLISSLRLLMGDRSDFSKIRRTDDGVAEEAFAEARFSLSELPRGTKESIKTQLDDCGGEQDDDGSVIVLRRIRSDGRSRAHLGGRTVPASALTAFTEPLITIHGQHDQLRLLKPDEQRAVLDKFAGQNAEKLIHDYRVQWHRWREVASKLKRRQEQSVADARELTQLEMALEEIAKAKLEAGEDSTLQNEIRRLMDADELREAASVALLHINGDESYLSTEVAGQQRYGEGSTFASEDLGVARSALSNADDHALKDLSNRLDEVLSILEDVASDLNEFLDDLDVDPALVERKLERQAQLKQIVRKYGTDVDSVLRWSEQAQNRVNKLSSAENSVESLITQELEERQKTAQLAQQLSTLRHQKSKNLSAGISKVLKNLAMGSTEVEVRVADISTSDNDPLNVAGRHLGEFGADFVDIQLRPSKNAEGQPLSKVASGGELSRVMLAIEVVLADKSDPRTLIFDEVDAGIGGRTALEIGKCLARLGERHQIIVVTHLPQVAAYGDDHLTVQKQTTEGGALTSVLSLDNDHRVKEIARMLAGLDDTETGQAHAEELLSAAAKTKVQR